MEAKILVGFLWFSFIVDLAGFYPAYAYFTNYESLGFIKDTPFERNYWLFNIRNIVEYLVFVFYFLSQLNPSTYKTFVKPVALGMVPVMIINLMFSDVFFKAYSQLTTLTTTFIYLLLIFRYFYEVLQNDKIMNFYKFVTFYIALGLMLWHLCITPLSLYSIYFKAVNVEFIDLYRIVLLSMNTILYGSLIFGFIYCSFRKDGYAEVRSEN